MKKQVTLEKNFLKRKKNRIFPLVAIFELILSFSQYTIWTFYRRILFYPIISSKWFIQSTFKESKSKIYFVFIKNLWLEC